MRMLKKVLVVTGMVGVVVAGLSSAHGDIPLMINHQGLVKVDGFPFDGTGQFRFAIVDPDSGHNVWTNDGTKLGTSQTPTDPVTLPVVKGMYNVRLGDASISNMTVIPSTVFDDDNVVLRVWFSDGTHGTEQLDPDQVITSGAYAYHAATADAATTANLLDGQGPSAYRVPSGSYIIGGTQTPPSGYTYTGISFEAGWSPKAPMPTGRNGLAGAAVDGMLYAIGGYSAATQYETANEVYDPATNSWSIRTPMPTGRCSLAAAVVNGLVYAFGGISGPGDASYEVANEAYDPVGDSWSTKAPMPTGRRHLAAAEVGGVAYVFGGEAESGSYQTTNEAYDPTGNSWSTKAPMPTGRHLLAAAVVDGVVYVIGGYSAGEQYETANESYDPASDSWTVKAPMPTGRHSLTVTAISGMLYAIGGESSGILYQTVNEAYNPGRNSWSTKTPMPTGRRLHVAAVLDKAIYAIGGRSSGSSYETANEAYVPLLYAFRKD